MTIKDTFCQTTAIAFSLVLLAFAANSKVNADTTLEFTSAAPSLMDGLADGDSVSVDGITITFSDVVISNGDPSGSVEEEGILLSSSLEAANNDVVRFGFSFNQDVTVSEYTIGLREDIPMSSAFVIGGPSGMTGSNPIPEGTNFTDELFSFDTGSISVFEAGEIYNFTHNLPSVRDPLFDLKSFTVSAVTIPEPTSIGVLVAGVVGILGPRRR